MSLPRNRFDVVVIGGGPAGTAVALALVTQGVSVLVVERSNYQQLRFGETLPPEIQPTLSRLGLWHGFLQAHHLRSVGIRSIWGSTEPYDQSFIFNPYNDGWHVDRRAFDEFLARAAQARGVQLALGASLLQCERSSDGGWELLGTAGDKEFSVEAKFVIDAAGRTCPLARKLGQRRITYDRLVGIYGFFTGNYDSDEPYTLVEAVEDGWWYSAPLPGSSRVVAFMTDADLCSRLLMRNVSHWEAQLDRAPHTKAQVARLQFSGRLDLLAANSSHLDRVCGRNWLAIGDAASSFDPLSGAGVLRALQSGMKAAEVIFSWLSGKESGSQEYSFACEQEFRDYLRQGHRYYQREQRWTSAPFWARRHSANFALAPASGLT